MLGRLLVKMKQWRLQDLLGLHLQDALVDEDHIVGDDKACVPNAMGTQ